jgi:RHS repeat-associated protein
VTLPANVTGTTSYNADNEQSKFNGTSLSYDSNGNLTGDGTYTYTWDARNHLTQITQRRTTVGSFVYDGFGRRMSKTISGTTTQFLYDGLNPVQELNSSNGVVANLLTGLKIDEYFARTDTATSTFLADALGSTVGLVGSGGSIATNYTYQPFGATTVGGSVNGNSYEFTGRENDGTGLYFHRARYYSGTYQRFIGQDPIGFAGGVNLYAYTLNNPSSWIDPYGFVTGDKTYGLPSDFWNWYHRQIKQPGDPDLDKDQANWWYNQWQQEGQPDPEGHRTRKGSSNACSATPPPEPWTPQAEHPPFPWGQSTVPGIPSIGPDLPPASIPGGIPGTVPGVIPGQVEPMPAL